MVLDLLLEDVDPGVEGLVLSVRFRELVDELLDELVLLDALENLVLLFLSRLAGGWIEDVFLDLRVHGQLIADAPDDFLPLREGFLREPLEFLEELPDRLVVGCQDFDRILVGHVVSPVLTLNTTSRLPETPDAEYGGVYLYERATADSALRARVGVWTDQQLRRSRQRAAPSRPSRGVRC